MPSNHISNEPYHEWLRDTARRKEEEKKIANQYVSTRPLPKGGWEIVVRVASDDELPIALRKVYESIGKKAE